MAQFAVYRNPNPDTRAAYPLLLNVQSDLLDDLDTRVVVPLCPAPVVGNRLMSTLTPLLEIEGDSYAMLTPQLAGIAKRHLGEQVADLSPRRDAIIAALDMLITGIRGLAGASRADDPRRAARRRTSPCGRAAEPNASAASGSGVTGNTRSGMRHLERRVAVLHFNPVKHGWAQRLVDWPHSTRDACIARGMATPDWGAGARDDGGDYGKR
jgi:toxin CcdB